MVHVKKKPKVHFGLDQLDPYVLCDMSVGLKRKYRRKSMASERKTSSPLCPVISAQAFDLVIFDLDGVITKTAELHAAAWKRLFDSYLQRRQGTDAEPFDADADYRAYVDGKPRYDGVKSFLASRGITLPYGDPGDDPMKETICGLGNAKNQAFLASLKEEGVQTYQDAIDLVRRLREEGTAVVVVSSSKSCLAILQAAGIADLFEERVNGLEAAKLGLPGKPAPDTFLEAAQRVGVEPARAVVIEDALSGVEAGRKGGFGLVIGVDRAGQRNVLLQHGADVVVTQLSEIQVMGLPSALDSLAAIYKQLSDGHVAVFLDYDGTLTPIAARPEDAALSDSMRETIRALAEYCPIAIVTGRTMDDIKDRVGLDNLNYATDHGFEIAHPDGERIHHEQAASMLPIIDSAEEGLSARLAKIRGTMVERKRFSVAVHYRLAAPEDIPAVTQAVEEVHAAHPNLRKLEGKKVVELQPRVDWDKGKVVLWLLESLGLACEHMLYIGDDVTDEDALRAVADCGIGIVVWDRPRATAAAYYLTSPAEVEQFLRQLLQHLGDAKA